MSDIGIDTRAEYGRNAARAGALDGAPYDMTVLIGEALYTNDVAREVIERTSTFLDMDVLTDAPGLVVECHDGSEYKITIVQSRWCERMERKRTTEQGL